MSITRPYRILSDIIRSADIHHSLTLTLPLALTLTLTLAQLSRRTASQFNIPTDVTLDCHTGRVMVQCVNPFGDQKQVSPEDISAEILGCLKRCAEEYLRRRPVRDGGMGGTSLSSLQGDTYLIHHQHAVIDYVFGSCDGVK